MYRSVTLESQLSSHPSPFPPLYLEDDRIAKTAQTTMALLHASRKIENNSSGHNSLQDRVPVVVRDVILGRKGRNKASDDYFRSVVSRWCAAYAATTSSKKTNTSDIIKKKDEIINSIRTEFNNAQGGVRFLEMNKQTKLLEVVQQQDRIDFSIKRCLQRMIRERRRIEREQEQLLLSSPEPWSPGGELLSPEWIKFSAKTDVVASKTIDKGSRRGSLFKFAADLDQSKAGSNSHHLIAATGVPVCEESEQHPGDQMVDVLPRNQKEGQHWIHYMNAAECPSLLSSSSEETEKDMQGTVENKTEATMHPEQLDLHTSRHLRSTSDAFSIISMDLVASAVMEDWAAEDFVAENNSTAATLLSSDGSHLATAEKEQEVLPFPSLISFNCSEFDEAASLHVKRGENKTTASNDEVDVDPSPGLSVFSPTLGEAPGVFPSPSPPPRKKLKTATALPLLPFGIVATAIGINGNGTQQEQPPAKPSAVTTFPSVFTDHLSKLQKSVRVLLDCNNRMKERLEALEGEGANSGKNLAF